MFARPLFFQNLVGADEETVARAVDGLDLNLEDFGEDEDDCASFVDLGKNMTNVTADGGVKKKVIKPGLEMEGLVPGRGTVTIHYKMFVEGQDESFDSTWMRMKPERFQVQSIQTICYTCNALRMYCLKNWNLFLRLSLRSMYITHLRIRSVHVRTYVRNLRLFQAYLHNILELNFMVKKTKKTD